MGGSNSREEDLGPLPQQQIVSMSDGTVTPGQAPVAPGVRGQVGSSMKGTAVRAPVRLPREGIRLLPGGVVELEVDASVNGVVHLLAPAIEAKRPGGDTSGANGGGGQTAVWPMIKSHPSGVSTARSAPSGQRRTIRFDRSGEALWPQDQQNCNRQADGSATWRWPLVLVLRPGAATASDAFHDPPDGTLTACCIVENGQIKVARQIIAWGGGGAAYVLKELYGIQEARAAGAAAEGSGDSVMDNQTQCVVCLTSPKDTALMPCGHFCVCYECGVSIRLSPARNRCPLCRRDVADIVHIDVAQQEARSVPPQAAPVATAPPETSAGSGGGYGLVAPTAEGPSPVVGASETVAEPSAPSCGSSACPPPSPPMDEVRAARLRRLGQQAEPEQDHRTAPPTAASSSSAPVSSGSEDLPPPCLRRLTQEMRQIEQRGQQHFTDHGVKVALSDPEGADLRVWSIIVLTSHVDADSELGKQLRSAGARQIELEVWIPNNFPVEPPKVRVLRPTFNKGSFFVQDHGALCLEILTRQGWTAAMSLLQLGVQVKMMMGQGSGIVASLNTVDGSREAAWKTAARIEDLHSDWKHFSTI